MKMNMLSVVMLLVGGVLVYAAFKNMSPKDVVGIALGNKTTASPASNPVTAQPNPQGSGTNFA